MILVRFFHDLALHFTSAFGFLVRVNTTCLTDNNLLEDLEILYAEA